MEKLICPECGKELNIVPSSKCLNPEQYNSTKAGDYYCKNCKGNRGKTGYRYYWKEELNNSQEQLLTKLQLNKEWSVTLKLIDNKYLRIESDCDMSIYPDTPSQITLGGGWDNMYDQTGEVFNRGV